MSQTTPRTLFVSFAIVVACAGAVGVAGWAWRGVRPPSAPAIARAPVVEAPQQRPAAPQRDLDMFGGVAEPASRLPAAAPTLRPAQDSAAPAAQASAPPAAPDETPSPLLGPLASAPTLPIPQPPPGADDPDEPAAAPAPDGIVPLPTPRPADLGLDAPREAFVPLPPPRPRDLPRDPPTVLASAAPPSGRSEPPASAFAPAPPAGAPAVPVIVKPAAPANATPIEPPTSAPPVVSGPFKRGQAAFVRIFKKEGELELWLRNGPRYTLYKTFPICKWSGTLGPKLKTGDNQAPEGFYSVSSRQLNPNSAYHLAFNVGFPNAYDRRNGRTGSALMVHGDCKSVGCYAMTNPGIEQIYGFVEAALRGGQGEVPVHIFPFRMTQAAIDRETKGGFFSRAEHAQWAGFWQNLKEGYDLFERTREPPVAYACGQRYAFGAIGRACTRIAGW